MRKVLLIIQREYIVRVRTKAFVIFTVLMPLLVGMVVVLPSKLMMQSGGTKHIVIVAADSTLANSMKSELSASRASVDDEVLQTDRKRSEKPEFDVSVQSAPTRSIAPAAHHAGPRWRSRRLRLDRRRCGPHSQRNLLFAKCQRLHRSFAGKPRAALRTE